MLDREKVIEAFTRCGTPGACSDKCAYFAEGFNCYRAMKHDLLELLKKQQEQKMFVDSDGKITPLPIQPQWHPFDPLEPDNTGLNDHNFYLVTVKGFGTPMKAMYHIDMPFGFTPPPTKDFDPYDVIAWCELPDNMPEEVKQDGIQ